MVGSMISWLTDPEMEAAGSNGLRQGVPQIWRQQQPEDARLAPYVVTPVERSLPSPVNESEKLISYYDNSSDGSPVDGLLPPSGQDSRPLAWYCLVLSYLWAICCSLRYYRLPHFTETPVGGRGTKDNIPARTQWLQLWNDLHAHQKTSGCIAFDVSGFTKSPYFPVATQQALTTDHRLAALIQDEPGAPNDRFFLEKVKKARTVLLICAYQRIGFSVFQSMIESEITDDSLPLRQDNVAGLVRDGVNENHLVEFIKCQRYFRPARLGGTNLKNFHNEEMIIPFTNRVSIGSGTCSTVCKVTLHSSEHDISSDQLEEKEQLNLALKVRREENSFLDEEWRREQAIFQKLRHPHIIQLLATFSVSYSGILKHRCMLLPLADCHLRDVIRKLLSPSLSLLLEQLVGLADALCLVHSDENKDSNRSTTGYHHDIKPANILFFRVAGSDFGVLRLADWGSAKLHQKLQSGSSCGTNSRYKGDPFYAPPESNTGDAKVSRPYDSWSMGCVILEMLVWHVFGPQEVEKFEKFREITISGFLDKAFWIHGPDGTPCRREGVNEYMRRVGEHHKNKNISELLILVEKLLCPDPRKRLKMAELKEGLERVLRQVR